MNIRLSRFDRTVMIVLVAALTLTTLVIWRGDRVGVQVLALSPALAAEEVSTQADLRAVLSQPLRLPEEGVNLNIDPPVGGNLRWEGNAVIFTPDAPLQADTAYTATLPAGLSGTRGRVLLQPLQWRFRTSPARLLYIVAAGQGEEHLVLASLAGDEAPVTLAQAQHGIWDYALSPDGRTVVYAALNADGSSDLWSLRIDGGEPALLVECTSANCSGAAWSPDGRTLLYERRNFIGPPRLWWLNVASGETNLLFDDAQILGFAAHWSPDGRWINYVAPLEGVRLYNLADGDSLVVASQMGEPGVWSPEGDAIVMTDVQVQGERFNVHMLRVDVESGEVLNLSGEEAPVEDGSPVWSPDGAWIAFGRTLSQVAVGAQLWVMRPDGSEARALTEDYEVHHGAPSWSPDGRYLLFQRFRLREIGALPGVAVYDLSTGALREIAAQGRQPVWVP